MVQRIKRGERRRRQMDTVLRAIAEVFARTAVNLKRTGEKLEQLARKVAGRSDA